ncbi:diguanylate cyclase [Gallaecimonas pentaromativorans]|uniref:GGDEF domain-containing protein n=1 Tax=Gallaecimonas pentaromativorans TaxID=584787 RepID=UPI003A8CDE31
MSEPFNLTPSSLDKRQTFGQWYQEAKLPQIRYIAFITAALYLIYAALEYSLHLGVQRLWFHGLLVPLTLVLIGAFSFFPPLHGAMRVLLMLAPVVAVLGNLYFNLGTPSFAYFAPELYLNIVWSFAISGLTLSYAAVAATSAVLVTLLAGVLKGVGGPFIGLHLLWMLSAYLFGLVTALVLEWAYRCLYRQQCALLHSASTDDLTGLWNREKMAGLFELEKQKGQAQAKPLAVIMLDIDFFKTVNDTFGHSVGDKVLGSFATLLRRHVRQQDHVGRHGGEEFFILLPETDAAQASAVAQDLRQRINQFHFEEVGNKTASFGVTQYQSGESLSQLLTRADRALYQAKAKGRNCIEVV